MKFSLCIGALAAISGVAADTSNPPIRNIYTFPPNHFIENIAVRANGRLLITSMSVPQLFSIDPTVATPTAEVVHTFSNITGISGIAEISPDVFALVTATWDLASTRAELGSIRIWKVDFRRGPGGPGPGPGPATTASSSSPTISLLATVANSISFNGIARHPTNPRLLLAADSALGAVWRVDLETGAYGVAFQSEVLAPVGTEPGTNLGINGLKGEGGHVYFTNSARRFFGRVGIDGAGNRVGEVEVISGSADAGADVVYDDFALDGKPGKGGGGGARAWIASHPSYAVEVTFGGSGGGPASQRVVNDTALLLNPTAAAFGRGSRLQERTLYVTNGGEFVGFDLVNEGVVAIDLS
ncbi:hypothetical protein QBC47DRAFT_121156 [Echria macrotheca]|uniref:Uncharacterized protein n=1 Tax=Echria macrotheca TaxID=438768 RepID=A0AAJ0B6W0_9PEZI|nr:hypothetical protein QBC47DRAFT_121156 [Echria macrotheca]